MSWDLECPGGSVLAPTPRGGMGPRWSGQEQQPSRAGGPPPRSFATPHLPGSLRGCLTPPCVPGDIAQVKLLRRAPRNLHSQPKTTPHLPASLPRSALGTVRSPPTSADAQCAHKEQCREWRENKTIPWSETTSPLPHPAWQSQRLSAHPGPHPPPPQSGAVTGELPLGASRLA